MGGNFNRISTAFPGFQFGFTDYIIKTASRGKTTFTDAYFSQYFYPVWNLIMWHENLNFQIIIDGGIFLNDIRSYLWAA